MKLATINKINEMLTAAVKKADADYTAAKSAAEEHRNALCDLLMDRMSRCELDRLYHNSEQYKTYNEALTVLQAIERTRDDFLDHDWK